VVSKELPETIGGRYRVEAELGRGMMGVVYKAHDPVMARSVALKVVQLAFPVTKEQREEFEQRFLSEARIVARLSHPNIVVAFDVGRDETEGKPFMALEYLVGRTLDVVLTEDGAPDWRESLRITARVASALHYAHQQGVVHRDIKPANIMILGSGEPKIMDFGLAKQRAGLELTSTGQFMGTPMYMAPEQAAGGAVDGRTDLFSLGAVAYTMVTGAKAFDGENVMQILNRVTQQDPPPPSRISKKLPKALDNVLLRVLSKDPEARYSDGSHFAEDLQDVIDGRSPRHLAGWKAPKRVERTVLSPPATDVEELPELELTSETRVAAPPAKSETKSKAKAKPRRRRRWKLRLALLAVAALAVAAYRSPEWRPLLLEGARAVQAQIPSEWGLPVIFPPPPEVPADPEPQEDPEPLADDAFPDGPTVPMTDYGTVDDAGDLDLEPEDWAAQGRAAQGRASSPAPPATTPASPEPSAEASPAPDATPTPTPAPRPTARFRLAVNHDVAKGQIRVLIDNRLRIRRTLRGTTTRHMVLLSRVRGSLSSQVRVPTGRRRVHVEVRSSAGRYSKQLQARFRRNRTYNLVVDVSDGGRKIEARWR